MSLESDIKNMVESIGLTFYDAVTLSENGATIYRVSVTAPGGVTLEQCVEATHLISPLLDVTPPWTTPQKFTPITPPVSGEYRLEVSSPGIERKLKTLDHFAGSVGEKIALTTGSKEQYRGVLLRVEDETIVIDDAEAGETAVAFGDVAKAKTYFEW